MKIRCLVLLTLIMTACQTSPTGRKQLIALPEEQLNAMGEQAFNDLKAKEKVESDAKINAFVKCVANSITSTLPEKREWEVVVFRNDQANAFALPGGKIGVYTGMLKVAKNPSQLAAVLGHEVAHVLARHSNERLTGQFAAQGGLQAIAIIMSKKQGPKYNLIMAALGLGAQYGILLPYSRAQETEADVMGVEYMARAGFNPRESVELWKNMDQAGGGSPPEILSSHPSHGTRIETLESKMSEATEAFESSRHRPDCRI